MKPTYSTIRDEAPFFYDFSEFYNGRIKEIEKRLKQDRVYRDLHRMLSVAAKKGDIEAAAGIADEIIKAYKGDFEAPYLDTIVMPSLIRAQRTRMEKSGLLEQIKQDAKNKTMN